MSKWFGITVVVLLVFWLSVLSLTQRMLSAATHNSSLLIMQHEANLTAIRLHMTRPVAPARPASQFAAPNSGGASKEGKHASFSEKLPQDAQPAGARRESQRKFSRPICGSGGKQAS